MWRDSAISDPSRCLGTFGGCFAKSLCLDRCGSCGAQFNGLGVQEGWVTWIKAAYSCACWLKKIGVAHKTCAILNKRHGLKDRKNPGLRARHEEIPVMNHVVEIRLAISFFLGGCKQSAWLHERRWTGARCIFVWGICWWGRSKWLQSDFIDISLSLYIFICGYVTFIYLFIILLV